MRSRTASKRTTRARAAVAPVPPTNIAGPSTAQQPHPAASSASSPMKTRSGRILAPIAEGAKKMRSKLTGGRRSTKATAEAQPAAESSAAAAADTTSSNAVDAAPAPAPRKPAAKKRATTARTRSTKGKGKGKAAAIDEPTPSFADDEEAPLHSAESPSSIPANVVHPSDSAPAPGPSTAASTSASGSNPNPPRFVPEYRRLRRQGAYFFDKNGVPLPKGVYPSKEDKIPSLSPLEELKKEIPLKDLMRSRKVKPGRSIYGLKDYMRRDSYIYQPFRFRKVLAPGPIVFPSVPRPPAPAAQPPVASGPIVFPAVEQREPSPEAPTPTIGTRLTRQYAAFFDEDGYPLPIGREDDGEPAPIGEIVANILKAGRSPPYPPTWRGSLFEPEDEAPRVPTLPASPPASPDGSRPTRPLPQRRGQPLRRHNAVILDRAALGLPLPPSPGAQQPLPPTPPTPSAPPHTRIPPGRRLTRQHAILIDLDELGIPPAGPSTPAAPLARPPSPKTPPAPVAGPSTEGPKDIPGAAGSAAPTGLRGLFARRSRSQLASFDVQTAKDAAGGEAPAPATQAVPAEDAAQEAALEAEAPTAPAADVKGKKRARDADVEDETVEAVEQPRVKRLRTVCVRSHTQQFSLLRVTCSVIPIPPGVKDGDKLLVFPPGKGPLAVTASKRSREDFEAENAPAADDADERAAKKARVDDAQ